MKKCTEPILAGTNHPKTQEQPARIKQAMWRSLQGHMCGPLYWTPSLIFCHLWWPVTVLRYVC